MEHSDGIYHEMGPWALKNGQWHEFTGGEGAGYLGLGAYSARDISVNIGYHV